MRSRVYLLSFAAVAFLAWTGLALGAARRVVPEERLTRKELKEYYEKLTEQGWSAEQFKLALKVCKGSQPLLDIFIDLHNKKVPTRYISRSFYCVKGAPDVVREYWEYAVKWRFHPDEVDTIFRKFPPNRIVRWHYFEYRSGGLIDPSDKKAKREKPYNNSECMTVFRLFRCDMNFIKRYFDERRKGTPRSKALLPLYAELSEKIKKEQEEKKKKEEERRKLLAEKREQHKEVLGTSKPKTALEKEPAAKKEKEEEYVVLSKEELEKLLQVMDKEESAKAAKESRKAEKKDEAEPSKEEPEAEKEVEEESESESEGSEE